MFATVDLPYREEYLTKKEDIKPFVHYKEQDDKTMAYCTISQLDEGTRPGIKKTELAEPESLHSHLTPWNLIITLGVKVEC